MRLQKKTPVETGGLPHKIIFVNNLPYVITKNIDVLDGIANGNVGKLMNLEFDDNKLIRVWQKFAHRIQELNIDRYSVPIKLVTTSSPISIHNRNTVIKRTHFPLSAFNASTIHKAQGGTYDEVVYHYEKGHAQDLVYVALIRVTSLNGLFIVSEDGKKKFFHTGR